MAEKQELRQDMKESSAWANVELNTDETQKIKKFTHGIDDGIDKPFLYNKLLFLFIFFSLIFEWE
ncbi:hypothetical protein [Escherichia coli]|uniref:hypothetical protein n=1 Tax=Escherichia coli TaxID=562 RepID=UPI00069AFB5E|nr:hypothetical protein [Escherichia coli]